MKYLNTIIYVTLLLALFSCNNNLETEAEKQYPEINTFEQIDSVLSTFEHISFDEMDVRYMEATGYDKTYSGKLYGKLILKIYKQDVNKNLVGLFPIKCFLSKGADYNQLMNENEAFTYLIIDKKLIYKILELQNILREQKLNHNGFWVRDGLRTPNWNYRRGGVDGSRHIRGEAVDIIVGDIDLDGKADKKDKEILIKILNEEVIKNEGGIGRYPESMVIHFDTRGYGARWDHQRQRK
jgi:uncharacterized protein YcbK (DUF882 family)